jgi:transglutaminase-like putative cysteine protease
MSKSFLKRKNNMRRFFSVGVLLTCFFAKASDIKYPVSSIPESLKKNANVVKRMEEIVFEIANLKEAVYRRKVAYTILNENGEKYAAMVVGYDKLRKVTALDGALYDVKGNILKKSKSKDIQDISAVQDISLFDDNRIKVLDFTNQFYPYTVEFETEVKYNNTYMLPDWFPQVDEKLSVESSSYSFIAPADYVIRFKAFNYSGQPSSSTEKSKQIKTWKVSNLTAVKKLFASPTWNELTPCVYFAPSDFEMEGYKGNGTSWQDLGKFPFALNEGRDKLPDDIVQKVSELTKDVKDERGKVKVLYNFLQQNTRYISIQLGIGGLQPFEASFVAKKGYGDCKALSNYMYSLLKAAGIKSYYTLVKGGTDLDDKYLVEDFPSDQFNHIILCVPLSKDTMWLECTSQTESPGYMGDFTGNRKALLITEDGGKLVSTPHYGIKENIQIRNIKGKINSDGALSMNVTTNYRCIQQDEKSALINQLSKDKVKKYLQEDLELSTYEVNNFKYEQKKSVLPEIDEQLDVVVDNYATITGKRLFIIPNILSRGGMKLSDEEERKIDFVLDYEFRDEDDYEIEIPEGYQLEAMPQDVSLKTKFGTYSCSTKLNGNKIIYHRVREQFSGRFPAKDQQELANFFEDIYKADRAKMVLVKKTE